MNHMKNMFLTYAGFSIPHFPASPCDRMSTDPIKFLSVFITLGTRLPTPESPLSLHPASESGRFVPAMPVENKD